MKTFLTIAMLIFATTANSATTRSLSGDNWQNPKRDKTWTPPSISDTLVGETATQELTNKTIDGGLNTFVDLPASSIELDDFEALAGDVLPTDTGMQAINKINSKQSKAISGETALAIDLKTLKAPHKTLTDTGSGTLNVEHGSNQRLYNGSFESGSQGWTCSPGAVVADSQHIDQASSLKLVGLSGADVECYQDYSSLDEGALMHEINAWFRFIGDPLLGKPTKGEICARQNGVNVNCVTFDASKDQWNLQQTFADAGTSTTGIYFKMYGDGTNTYNVLVDKTLAGVYTATNSYMDVTQATQWQPCTFSTLAWQGLGTITTNNLICKRDGSNLLITGSFVNGTVTGDEVRIPLPSNYGVIGTVSSLGYLGVGTYYVGGTAVSGKGGAVVAASGVPNFIRLGNKDTFGGSASPAGDPLVLATGTQITSSRTVLLESISIPISEWQQNLNVAVSKCLEGPLKCANRYSATVIGNVVVKSDVGNWITSASYAAGMHTINLNPNAGFTVPPTCFFQRYLAQTSWTSNDDGGSLAETSVSVARWMSASSQVQLNYNVTCIKSFPDNTNYDNISVAPLMDIRSTEFLTGGFDHIDGKPIYRRCHRVATSMTATGVITTWPANLTPVGLINWGGAFVIQSAYVSSGYGSAVSYVNTTGGVHFERSATAQLAAGTTFCMNYTKP